MAKVEAMVARIPPDRDYFFAQISGGGQSAQCFYERLNFDRSKVQVGAVISFDFNDNGRGPRALRPITLIREAGQPDEPSSAIESKSSTQMLWPTVSLEFGDLLKSTAEETLPLIARLSLNGRPAAGWKVELFQDGGQIMRPEKKPSTSDKGEAAFIAALYNGEPIMPFTVKVQHLANPRKAQTSSFVWNRVNAPVVHVPDLVASEIKFVRSWVTPTIYRFDLEYLPGQEISIESKLEIKWRRPGEQSWKGLKDTFATDHQGKAVIELTLPEDQRGPVVFRSGEVLSEPAYVYNNKGVQSLTLTP